MPDTAAFRLPKCRCPHCEQELDAAMSADPADPDAAPSPGDVTVCISCAQLLVFTDDLLLRAARPGEVEMTPVMRRAQRLVRRLDRRAGGGQ